MGALLAGFCPFTRRPPPCGRWCVPSSCRTSQGWEQQRLHSAHRLSPVGICACVCPDPHVLPCASSHQRFPFPPHPAEVIQLSGLLSTPSSPSEVAEPGSRDPPVSLLIRSIHPCLCRCSPRTGGCPSPAGAAVPGGAPAGPGPTGAPTAQREGGREGLALYNLQSPGLSMLGTEILTGGVKCEQGDESGDGCLVIKASDSRRPDSYIAVSVLWGTGEPCEGQSVAEETRVCPVAVLLTVTGGCPGRVRLSCAPHAGSPLLSNSFIQQPVPTPGEGRARARTPEWRDAVLPASCHGRRRRLKWSCVMGRGVKMGQGLPLRTSLVTLIA